MENENAYRVELLKKYREASESLLRYIPYFEQKMGQQNVQLYQGNDITDHSVAIPVYDSTLLAFVKEVQATGLVDRNYVYVLSRYAVRKAEEETLAIEKAEFKDIELVYAVMAKYVLGGMTKGRMWSQAVTEGIFLQALKKLKLLLEVWDEPLA